jgi:class 3 adenylate cyclase
MPIILMLAPAERPLRAQIEQVMGDRVAAVLQKPVKLASLLSALEHATAPLISPPDSRRGSISLPYPPSLSAPPPPPFSLQFEAASPGRTPPHLMMSPPPPPALRNSVQSSLSPHNALSVHARVPRGVAQVYAVLLLETDPAVRDSIMNALGGVRPKEIKVANSPEEVAMETVRAHYDLFLLNVSDRPLCGVDVIKTIRTLFKRSDRPGAPLRPVVIGYSRQPNDAEREACTEAGVDSYTQFPLTRESLEAVLANVPTVSHNVIPSSRITGSDRNVTKVLARFVPPQFQELIAPGRSLSSGLIGDADLRCISIIFSDIRNFTTMTERMYVKEVMKFVNTYLAFALPAIEAYDGFVDKFLGDGIMAIFAHSDVRLQATSAIRAALKVQHDLDFMAECGFRLVETGIGINTGRTIIGFVGTETRMSPTVLGDAVNLAARTEALCKVYGARVLITQNTLSQLASPTEFSLRLVDNVRVKGKAQPCKIYEVIDADPDAVRAAKMNALPAYNAAMDLVMAGKFTEALEQFHVCLKMTPDDKPTTIWTIRCENMIRAPPPEPWDGVFSTSDPSSTAVPPVSRP